MTPKIVLLNYAPLKARGVPRNVPAILFRKLVISTLAVLSLLVASPQWAIAQEGRPHRGMDQQRDVPFGLDQLLVPRWRLTDGPHVRAAFREVVKNASKSAVRIHADGKQVALGGIVGRDGWILTKASTLRGDIECQLPDGRSLAANIVGVSGEYDLALLKIEATGLSELAFASKPPPLGSMLATVGQGRDPEAVGVVSVTTREIPAQPGVLGVRLDPQNRPIIMKVFPGSGADRAGVKEGDQVTSVNGQPTSTSRQIIMAVHGFNPGDEVTLQIKREDKTIKVDAVLSARFPGLPKSRSQFQNSLGGELSVRRFGFPKAFQHDTVLAPNQCGGPIVNLDGKVVGFNLARSGRTESYAVDIETVTDLLFDLRSGKLPPRRKSLEASRLAPAP